MRLTNQPGHFILPNKLFWLILLKEFIMNSLRLIGNRQLTSLSRSIPFGLFTGIVLLGLLIAYHLVPISFVARIPPPIFIVFWYILVPIIAILSIVRGHVMRSTYLQRNDAILLGRNDAGLALSYLALIFTMLQLRAF